ncbi:unnamed protein product [Xylocopa violacea]|uniref:Glycine-rich protein n=1 Tax=Xylocopa violacea TaxID=135666 RepID=A0ABP1PH64_XYLVO
MPEMVRLSSRTRAELVYPLNDNYIYVRCRQGDAVGGGGNGGESAERWERYGEDDGDDGNDDGSEEKSGGTEKRKRSGEVEMNEWGNDKLLSTPGPYARRSRYGWTEGRTDGRTNGHSGVGSTGIGFGD